MPGGEETKQMNGLPRDVNKVCKLYGVAPAEVKGYLVTPDYVRVTPQHSALGCVADGRELRQGVLPFGVDDPRLNLREVGGDDHD
jgi:hypothetical protein